MTLLRAFSLPGRFWRGNIHTHSTLSDGALAPQEVLETYRTAGYDFAVLSEHFVADFDWPLADTRAHRSSDFTTLIGAELHAPQTRVGELWHILAVGLPLGFAPTKPDEDGPALAQRARDAGAFIGIAHPAWSQLTFEDGISLDAAHAVEIYNHGCAVENDRGDGWYLLDQLANAGHRLTAFASDDAHFRTFERDAFGGWVHVKAEENTPEALLTALKNGDMYASQGPRIDAVERVGNALQVRTSPVDTVSVLGGTSRSVVHQGRDITEATLDMRDLSNGWLGEAESAWFRLVVIDRAGRRAWTNPIWHDSLADHAS
ncbi:MAG: CehA/McbA family metallohydrolase [Pseudomonadota bacterium]